MRQRSQGGRISLRTPWLWVVVGVVVVAALAVLNGICARPPRRPARLRAVDPSQEDFAIYARMLDSVAVEPQLLAPAPAELSREYARADSLLSTGKTWDVFDRLQRLADRASGARAFYIYAYIGLCRNRLRDHSGAVIAFEEALARADSAPPLLAARLAFNVGHIFQRFRMPDSTRVWYERALGWLSVPPDSGLSYARTPFLPALLNNLGVACDASGDTAAALNYLRMAATYLDTAAMTRDAARLRENLDRASTSGD